MFNILENKNQMRSLTFFLLLISMTFSLSYTAQSQNKDSIHGDYEALRDLYDVTEGPNWHNNAGWEEMTPETMGEAYGITTNSEGRVTEIRLFRNRLVNYKVDNRDEPILGSDGRYQLIEGKELKETIGNLKKLEYIDIRLNRLTGKIPDAFWTLTNLRFVSLGYRKSDVEDLEKTKWPYPSKGDYTGNKFTGSLPPEVKNLVDLERLFLERNYFDNTQIPREIGELKKLEHLHLGNNGFSGVIPPEIGNLSNLGQLNLKGERAEGGSGPYLTGEIPSELGNLEYLYELRLNRNNFSGGIPESFSNLKSLRRIVANNSNLSGPFPYWLNENNMELLQTIFLSRNNFSGEIPSDWKARDLTVFTMYGNNLSGELPESFLNSSHPSFPNGLIQWEFDYLNLEGPLPNDLKPLTNSRFVLLRDNSFTGELPDGYPQSQNIDRLWFNGNNITGPIKKELGDVPSPVLRDILLHENNLDSYESGAISPVTYDENGNYVHGLRRLSYFNALDNALKQADLDQIILDMWVNVQSRLGTEWENWGSGGSLRLQGQSTGEGPSDTAEINSAIQNLESAGWSVSFDGDRTPQSGDGGSGGDDDDTTPEIPTLSSPSNEAINVSITPEFSWSDEGADFYRFQVNVEGSSTFIIDRQINGTSFTPSNQLQHNTEYAWKVQAFKDGNSSDWSPPRRFTTVTDESDGDNDGSGGSDEGPGVIAAPVQVSPATNASDVANAIRFEWKSVAEADHYILHVTRENEQGLHEEFFYSDNENILISGTNYTVQKESLPGVIHSWRVRAVVEDVKGSWSPVWQFTTANTEDVLDIKTELNQNYPNPFNPATQIRYTVAESQQVSLKVYDMAGRLVVSLLDNETVNAGTHEVTFNANGLASGIYYYRFITEREIVTRKMTLMK